MENENQSEKEIFNEKLSRDAKIISTAKFDDIPTEEEWMKIQSEIDDL